jgi:hypothetical protein
MLCSQFAMPSFAVLIRRSGPLLWTSPMGTVPRLVLNRKVAILDLYADSI